MVRPRTTGKSHNKHSSTYETKRAVADDSKSQRSILDMLSTKKKPKTAEVQRTSDDDESEESIMGVVPEPVGDNEFDNNLDVSMEGNDSEISKDEAPLSEDEASDALGDMAEYFHNSRPYLAAQQAQAR